MSLTVEQVRKVAKLARIRLKDEEIPVYQEEISKILNWVEMLQEVNTDGVPRMASVCESEPSIREDEVNDGDIRDRVLQNAPNSQYGFFTVPKMVE